MSQPCDKCQGKGTVDRERVRRDDGTYESLGVQSRELCSKCGGSGAMPTVIPKNIPEKGFAADLASVTTMAEFRERINAAWASWIDARAKILGVKR